MTDAPHRSPASNALTDEAFGFLFQKVLKSHQDPSPSKRRTRGKVARVSRGFSRYGVIWLWGELLRNVWSSTPLLTWGRLAVMDHSSGLIRRFLETQRPSVAAAERPLRAPFPGAREVRAVAAEARRRAAGLVGDERAVALYVTIKAARWRRVYDQIAACRDIDALIVNDDMEPRRMASILAAVEGGKRLGYYVMTPGQRRIPPFSIDVLFCAEAKQLAAPYKAKARCLSRESTAVSTAVRPRRERYRVGLVTNMQTDDHLIRDAEEALARHTRCASVHVRVHPNYRSARYAPPTTPIERFLEDVDVVVIGTSGSWMEIALAGVPQIYSDRLDYSRLDDHANFADDKAIMDKGVVLRDAGPLEALDFDAAVDFRADPRFADRLASFHVRPAGAVSLAEGLASLSV